MHYPLAGQISDIKLLVFVFIRCCVGKSFYCKINADWPCFLVKRQQANLDELYIYGIWLSIKKWSYAIKLILRAYLQKVFLLFKSAHIQFPCKVVHLDLVLHQFHFLRWVHLGCCALWHCLVGDVGGRAMVGPNDHGGLSQP